MGIALVFLGIAFLPVEGLTRLWFLCSLFDDEMGYLLRGWACGHLQLFY